MTLIGLLIVLPIGFAIWSEPRIRVAPYLGRNIRRNPNHSPIDRQHLVRLVKRDELVFAAKGKRNDPRGGTPLKSLSWLDAWVCGASRTLAASNNKTKEPT